MDNLLPEDVAAYLLKKSFDKWSLEWNKAKGISNVVVIPAICEFENIKNVLLSLAENEKSALQKSIIIFVINNSLSADPKVKEDNKKSLYFLRSIINHNSLNEFSPILLNQNMNIGLVDASSEGNEMDDKTAGVGLARKIGMDLAFKIFDYSTSDKKLLICLDADCTVEKNYLSEIIKTFNEQNASAAIVDFEHHLPADLNETAGIISYEIFLRHYVTGLLFAKSPFAFHSVGSTIICEHEAYLKIGGMNTKKAAEDFYFLQKLAKHYKIHRIDSTKVKPSARESWRVPFGTGRSMNEIASGKKQIQVYDPDVYIILKDWLEIFSSDLSFDTKLILSEAEKIHPELFNFLEIRRFPYSWNKILSNSKSRNQLDFQKRNLFDGFETLKLLHHLRDKAFPMMEIKTGVEKLFRIIEHSAKFDLRTEQNEMFSLYSFYLSELKILEKTLYKRNYN